MIEWFHPGLVYILGAPLIPVLKGRLKQAYLLLLPVLPFLGYKLILGQIDRLSIVFAYVFVIASFCMMLYALHIQEDGQHVATSLYVGSTLGVVFAGDLF